MQVPFGEWLPDQPDHLKKGANVATNVYYAQNSYKKFPSLVDYSSNALAKDSKWVLDRKQLITPTTSNEYEEIILLNDNNETNLKIKLLIINCLCIF